MLKRMSLTLGALLWAPAAFAAFPEPWKIGLQTPASALAERANAFHTGVTIISVLIALFVMVLLGYVIVKFNAKANPVPSRTTHNTMVEVLWTAIPTLILIGVAIPSVGLLYAYSKTSPKDVELTIKAVGHQWYWSYEYPDNGNFTFDANMVPDADVAKDKSKIRLLSTDEPVVLPVDTRVRVLVTAPATDVIHSWAVPAFFNKIDAVPGRTNELLIDRVNKVGTYYGSCSELCGVAHAYMPIEVKIVTKAEFQRWAQDSARKFPKVGAAQPTTPAIVDLAAASARPATKE